MMIFWLLILLPTCLADHNAMDEDRPHHHHHPTDEATHHYQMTADASHEIKPKDEATHDHNKGDGHHHNENDGHTKGDGSLQKEEHQGEGLMKEFNGNVSDECTMHAEEDMPYPLYKICSDGQLSCPQFTPVETPNATCGFDIRVYGPGVYVRTDITLSQHSDIQTKLSTAFGLLVKYIKGANEGNVEIPMTAPVVTVYKMEDTLEPSGGSVMFYLPVEYHHNTPQPTDAEVSIYHMNGYSVRYVRAFKHSSPTAIKQEFRLLGQRLYKAGLNFNAQYPVILGYSAPWDTHQRHEVMFGAQGDWLSHAGLEVKRNKKAQHETKVELLEPVSYEKMCADVKCPEFTALDLPEGVSGFEVRKYSKANWVTTELTEQEVMRSDFEPKKSFKKLYSYFQGLNTAGTRIDMTAPVVIVWERSGMRMVAGRLQFYLPASEDLIPLPKDESVDIESQAEITLFLTALGGVPTEAKYKTAFKGLFDSITSAGLCADWSTPIVAVYSAPWSDEKRTELLVPRVDCEEEEEKEIEEEQEEDREEGDTEDEGIADEEQMEEKIEEEVKEEIVLDVEAEDATEESEEEHTIKFKKVKCKGKKCRRNKRKIGT